MFPSAKVGVFSDNFKKGTTSAQIADVVYDRYLITLTVGFEVNPRTLEMISYNPPSITLLENISISGSSDGPHLKHGENFKISPEQWRVVVEAGGQFSAAGIDVRTNEPVVGIEKLKAYLRRSPDQ